MRVSFAIQHHPSRADRARTLAETIGGDVDVVADPEPDGFRSPWRTYRLALELTPPDVTHRVVVQDDAIPCPRFRQAALAALAAQPDRVVSFFVAGSPPEYRDRIWTAGARDLSWIELWTPTPRWIPAIALAWPVRVIQPLLEFVDEQRWPVEFRADDEIIGRYTRHADERVLATVPSLVDHPDDMPSTVGLRAMGGADPARVAACFIGDCDPACIDWTLPPLTA